MMDSTARMSAPNAGPVPELGRLKAAAERVARARNNVENFLGRFHGQQGETVSGGGAEKPTDSYRNDLDTLFAQLDRLEGVVAALEHIG